MKQPLSVCVVRGQLVISIGSTTLKEAFERSEYNNPFRGSLNDFKRAFRVKKTARFAEDVGHALCVEGEDGSTLVTRLLDAACEYAVEQGSEGVEEL